jgi:2-polyprenyl-3-methyl-5-hydroxy-6-metoxy-1,4-benzoquinol methylase
MSEDKVYKHQDYLCRSVDVYAHKKYEILISWALDLRPGSSHILNVGCGSGEFNIFLAQQQDWSINAIDIDEKAVSLSSALKEKNECKNLTVTYDSIEAHVSPEPYELVFLIDVLEHLQAEQEAIEKIYKLLAPGGHVLLSVPSLPFLFGYHDEKLGHYRRYVKKYLIERFSSLFLIEKCRYFAASLLPVAWWYSCVFRKDYPIGRVGPLGEKVLEKIMNVEKQHEFFLGTSLLLCAQRR